MAGLEAGEVHRSDSWPQRWAQLSVLKGQNLSKPSGSSEQTVYSPVIDDSYFFKRAFIEFILIHTIF